MNAKPRNQEAGVGNFVKTGGYLLENNVGIRFRDGTRTTGFAAGTWIDQCRLLSASIHRVLEKKRLGQFHKHDLNADKLLPVKNTIQNRVINLALRLYLNHA